MQKEQFCDLPKDRLCPTASACLTLGCIRSATWRVFLSLGRAP